MRSWRSAVTGRASLSVAMATYNGERYLREQLDSLLAQTYSNIEIVAVDDASTDRTVELLREYERRDARVRPAAEVGSAIMIVGLSPAGFSRPICRRGAANLAEAF